jgi:DNA repair protein RadC
MKTNKTTNTGKTSYRSKYWIEDERPREMLQKMGAENLAPSKLLALSYSAQEPTESAQKMLQKN